MKITPKRIIAVLVLFACSLLFAFKIHFSLDPEFEGIFILEGDKGYWLEIADDLTPEDAPHLLWGMPLYPFKKIVESTARDMNRESNLDFRWDKKNGRGFIRNSWRDGRKIVINLGRFKESNGKYPSGLFIGGGLPPSDHDFQFLNNEATGMTYFNGTRWFHVWCNVNEGFMLPSSPFQPSYPSDWQFKGSRVLENDGTHLTIESKHRVLLAGVPLEFRRVLFYTSGDRHVILETEISNEGDVPVTFGYLYGDEPWIGDFGSSAGDIGWLKNELLFTEREVDVKRTSYIGMFDYGNPLAGEPHSFTGIANFIEWANNDEERPNMAYISNFSGGIMRKDKPIPLTSTANRFIGLQWGPSSLPAGESMHFTVAVGMADIDPKSGMPVKPETLLNPPLQSGR